MPLITPDFERYARRLNGVSFSETATPFYEMFSGALMWEDEKAPLPFSELGWFRAVLAYRTSKIMGQPRTEFESIWNALREIAPDWPGFREERCQSTSKLAEMVEKERNTAKRSIDRLEAVTSGRWKPLSGNNS